MKSTTTHIENALAANGTVLASDAEIRRLIGTVIFRSADWIDLIGGSWIVEHCMTKIVKSAIGHETPSGIINPFAHLPQWDDRASMEEKHWDWARDLKSLRRYSEEGIYAHSTAAEHESVELPLILREIERLALRIPAEWLDADQGAAYHSIWLIYGKACARLNLDQGRDLAFHEVVLLSGMTPKSVRNATQRRFGDRRLRVSSDDRVKNADAITWLLERNTFAPTPDAAYDIRERTDFDPEDLIFIPVSKDGRAFEPASACSQQPWGPGYRVVVDSTDEDGYFTTYIEALDAITRAPTATWLFNDGTWAEPSSWKRTSKREIRRQEKRAHEDRRVIGRAEFERAQEYRQEFLAEKKREKGEEPEE
jgi:hypothetical protein